MKLSSAKVSTKVQTEQKIPGDHIHGIYMYTSYFGNGDVIWDNCAQYEKTK